MWNFNFNQYKGRIVLAILLIIFVFALQFLGIGKYINIATFKVHKETLSQFIAQHYGLAVLIYISFFTLASFLSIPITIILNLVAGFFFGAFVGTLYINIGTTLGSTLSFLTFRYLLSGFVAHKYAEQLKALNAHIKEHGASYLLSMQLMPATPSFLINTLSGLTSIDVWTFIWTTSLGILPGSFVYAFAGQQLAIIKSTKDILTWPILLVLVLLGLVSLLPILIKRFKKN